MQQEPRQKKALVQINGLTIRFGEASVVRDLNLPVGRGETLAIVGESGSGKSLTALSLLQLLPPQAEVSGAILLTGNNGTENNPQDPDEAIDLTWLDTGQMEKIRGAQISMVFQEPMTSLNPVQTCGQQVAEAILIHQKRKRSAAVNKQAARNQVIQLFKEVRLPDPAAIYDKYPHQISGGQKQRVMIAMAVSCHPRLLICDEPTTALDVMVQKEILQLIKDLQQKSDMSVLFISHDIQLVAAIADQIAVLYKGDLVEYGPAAQILDHPAHPYTRALLSCRPGLYKKGDRLPVVADFLKSDRERIAEPLKEAAHAVSPANAGFPDPVPTETTTVPQKQEQPSAILQIRQLNVWYPTQRNFRGHTTGYYKAIQDLNLEVFRGETLGLVGGSGCGKTTLGRAIMGLTPIHNGKILFKERSFQNTGSKAQQRLPSEIQMIFQDPYSALNPRIPVGRAIGEAVLVHQGLSKKAAKNKVLEWLEKVGLQPGHYDRYPHEFSGGQRQRLVIARALILEPDFVICDESVSALDVSVQAQILNLLNDLKSELGFTTIFISHDLSVVRYIADRIAVMHEGRIAELGPAEQVYNHPASGYTKALLTAIPSPGRLNNNLRH